MNPKLPEWDQGRLSDHVPDNWDSKSSQHVLWVEDDARPHDAETVKQAWLRLFGVSVDDEVPLAKADHGDAFAALYSRGRILWNACDGSSIEQLKYMSLPESKEGDPNYLLEQLAIDGVHPGEEILRLRAELKTHQYWHNEAISLQGDSPGRTPSMVNSWIRNTMSRADKAEAKVAELEAQLKPRPMSEAPRDRFVTLCFIGQWEEQDGYSPGWRMDFGVTLGRTAPCGWLELRDAETKEGGA